MRKNTAGTDDFNRNKTPLKKRFKSNPSKGVKRPNAVLMMSPTGDVATLWRRRRTAAAARGTGGIEPPTRPSHGHMNRDGPQANRTPPPRLQAKVSLQTTALREECDHAGSCTPASSLRGTYAYCYTTWPDDVPPPGVAPGLLNLQVSVLARTLQGVMFTRRARQRRDERWEYGESNSLAKCICS